MPTKAKQDLIDSLSEMIKTSDAIFVCEYRGLTVKKATDLRSKIRKAGGLMKIAKNTLVKRALTQAGSPTLDKYDTGPNVYTMVYGDIAGVAKVLRDYAKEKGNEALVIKGGLMGGQILSKEDVLALADLPPREVLLAMVVGTLAAPLRSLVTVLSGPSRGLVTCLSQIAEQKEKAA